MTPLLLCHYSYLFLNPSHSVLKPKVSERKISLENGKRIHSAHAISTPGISRISVSVPPGKHTFVGSLEQSFADYFEMHHRLPGWRA